MYIPRRVPIIIDACRAQMIGTHIFTLVRDMWYVTWLCFINTTCAPRDLLSNKGSVLQVTWPLFVSRWLRERADFVCSLYLSVWRLCVYFTPDMIWTKLFCHDLILELVNLFCWTLELCQTWIILKANCGRFLLLFLFLQPNMAKLAGCHFIKAKVFCRRFCIVAFCSALCLQIVHSQTRVKQ